MGRKSDSPTQPPALAPESPDCNYEPEAPPAGYPGTSPEPLLNVDLTGLLGKLSSFSVDGDVRISVSDGGGEACEESSGGTSDGISIDLGTSSGTDGGSGLPLISLDSETEALINAPVLGEHDLLGSGIGETADLGSLLNAAMLDVGNVGSLSPIIGCEAYDGNVPLAGDLSSALGSTLDLLTTTSSLFDVPALDILGSDGLDG